MNEKSNLLPTTASPEQHTRQSPARSHRGWLLEQLRSTTILLGVFVLSIWLWIGLISDCIGFDNGDQTSTCSVGWLWGGGGEVVVPPQLQNSKKDKKHWHFSDITPSKDLKWKPCNGRYLCARLEVPLDYGKPDGPTAAIALLKIPAKKHTKHHAPSILINPGGPGGSGVDFALRAGEGLQFVAGEEHAIIGFDPRGVNNTTPAFDCFTYNQIARDIYMDGVNHRLVQANSSEFVERYLTGYGLARQCSQQQKNLKGGIGPHLSTPVVARDMLSIVEAEQREKNLAPEDGKLWYWGFSYGTILGMTFANLHPNRVGRLIVDGVADPEDYYKGDWYNNLRDTDKIMDKFYEYCFAAGPLACKFFTGSSPDDVKLRFWNLMAKLKTEPVLYAEDSPTGKPELIGFNDVKQMVFYALYNPFRNFPKLAEALRDLEKGDPKNAIAGAKMIMKCQCGIQEWERLEALPGIACGDASDIPKWSVEKFRTRNANLEKDSWFGDIWGKIPLYCASWDIDQRMPFKGKLEGNTSFPLLFMSALLDPVTPLQNAKKFAQRYKDAGLLLQDSEGHCTVSSPSLCIARHVRAYFETGTLPEYGTICKSDSKPFQSPKPLYQTEEVNQYMESFKQINNARQQRRIPSL